MEDLRITIKDFCKNNRITEKQFFGKEKTKGNLDLRNLTHVPDGFNPIVWGDLALSDLISLPEGFNPNVGGYLDLRSLTSLPKDFSPIVGGSLCLDSLTSLPDGFNPVVGGTLVLKSLRSLPEGFNPSVGGNLDLRNLTHLPKGFSPVVGGDLDLRNLTHLPDGFSPVVGGILYLNSLTSLPDGFNPTVGGSLFLKSLTSLPKGFSPSVGGNLYLSNLTHLPKDFSPIVGGWLGLDSLTSLHEGFSPNVGVSVYLKNDKIAINSKTKKIIEFKGGKYIKCDGIFTEVVSRKKNIYKVKKINQEKEFFLIVEGEFSAHGQTLKEAKKDLEFKILQDRIKKEPIYPDTIISVDKYRAITGACTHGVQMWLQENKITEKEMKAKDLFPLLKKTNAFGFDSFSKLYVDKTSII